MKLAIIPAKGTSRRIPGKNIREFHGKPIIAYSIQAAQQAIARGAFDRIVVSTDDYEVGHVAHEYGADVILRRKALCADEVGTQEVAYEAAEMMRATHVCCIYATAPMVQAQDLVAGMDSLGDRYYYAAGIGLDPLRDAGQFYCSDVSAMRDKRVLYRDSTRLVIVPRERVCDINTQADWDRALAMYSTMQAHATMYSTMQGSA